MITVYPYDALGHADHGWLDARHHFSFAGYHNPQRMNFGTLRVINDDRIAPGRGFAPHPHDNMEIITYVRTGAITHRDSMGNEGRTQAGNIQVMSAGSGITHSERNRETVETTLYQIWIEPDRKDIPPRWATAEFPVLPSLGSLPVLASGQARHAGTRALPIRQDAAIYGGRITGGTSLKQDITHQAYILVAAGEVTVQGTPLSRGDGAEVTGESVIEIAARTDSEVLVIDSP